MNISISDLIAVGSALVASLSALYARWAVKEAKRQNEISIHAERLNVYKGVNRFGSKLATHGPSIKDNDVWAFHEWVQLSEFYFSNSLYQRLNAALTNSFELLSKNDEWSTAKEDGNSNSVDISNQRHAIHRALRDECFSIAEAMKKNLRLDRS
jgi:hypothetical protein